jgi:predicted ATPase
MPDNSSRPPRRSTPLRHVEIEWFKSIRAASIDLKPLNAMVGVNSVGKSSFIQAILMVIQHLRDRESNETEYSLNENLVRLGSFAEVLNNTRNPETEAFRVALEIQPGRSPISRTIKWDVLLGRDPMRSTESRFAATRELSIELRQRNSEFQEQNNSETFKLAYSNIERTNFDSDIVLGDIEYLRKGVAIEQFPSGNGSSSNLFLMAPGELPQMYARYEVVGYVLAHLANELEKYRIRGQRAQQRRVSSNLAQQTGNFNRNIANEFAPLVDRLRRVVSEFLALLDRSEDQFDELSDLENDDFIERVPYIIAAFLSSLSRNSGMNSVAELDTSAVLEFIELDLRSLDNRLAKGRGREESGSSANLEIVGPIPQPPERESGNLFLRNRDLDRWIDVFYLGPIRDLEVRETTLPKRGDLGIKGQHTATVLQRESREFSREWPMPPGFSRRTFPREFGDVLNTWLQYLELATSVTYRDRGRNNPEVVVLPLSADVDDSVKEVDLTSVGMGVTQVLPVVMQCLIAKPGKSIVFVEQPELHLHPRVEQKLADFFVACAKTGRQIFIETHSEHLINRLRLDIARDNTGTTRNLVSVLFADRDEDGFTVYRNAEINDEGGLEGDWPEKFIDLSAETSLDLVANAVVNRRAAIFNDDDDEI